MTEHMEADFVIVGSGSAGSALAYRLGEDGRNSVLVLERGGSDFGPLIQMPSAFSIPMNMGRYNWDFVSAPEPHLGGRRLAVPRGKVIGGSSSINGMVFVRGHAGDFDAWETMGARGWGYRSVLPYFKRMETSHGGEPGWRGTDGPVHVTRGRSPNPLYGAFIEAGRQAGYGITEDYNGHRQEGFGKLEMTVWQGRRWSAANAYLRPALKRQNIGLETGVDVRRVLFEGRRAIGVEIARGGGRIERVRARREVIICASAINSPKILQLSGIGDAGHLRAHGIEVVADRPGVGANLQDHLEIYMQFAAKKPITLYSHLNWLSKLWIGATWLAFKSGLGATNHFEAGAFIRSRAGVRYPDIQFHFLPAAVRYDGRAVAKTHGFQMHVGPMRSKSRGHVRITSAAPEAAPEIRFNYLSMDEDREDFRACVRLTREIARQPALSDYLAYELTPGDSAQVDEALDEFVRSHVESAYHPCGTCRMGAADDPLAVVDSECRAIGVEGLRVVDSSIFPQIPNGNLNAPSMMVGEKAADLVLGRQPLPPSNLQPWVHPEWETAQR